MIRSTSCAFAFVVAAIVLAVAPSAFAADGTLLINQSSSVTGLPGCTHSGFPITICQSGSYRLSGNLTISDVNTDGIDVNASNVTLDLNGFTISGPITCIQSTYPVQCSNRGASTGIYAASPMFSNLTVINGTVRGMGAAGVFSNAFGTLVDGIHVESTGGASPVNGGTGIFVSNGTVTHCTSITNAADGIWENFGTVSLNSVAYNGLNGIRGGGVVRDNSSINNGASGILAAGLAVNNYVYENFGYGISFSPYLGNVVASNGGTVNGGTDMGNNLCNGSKTCP